MSKIREIITKQEAREISNTQEEAINLFHEDLLKALDVIADDLENIAVALYRMSAS